MPYLLWTVGRVIVDFLLKSQIATPNIDNIDKNQLNDEFRSIYFLKLAVQNRTSLMDISENSLIIISWVKCINKDYPTGWVWQTLANTYNKLTLTFNIWAKSHILWKNAWFSRTTYGRVICILQIHYCFPSVPLSLIIHWEGANISKLKKCLSVPPLLSSNK